MSSDTKTKTTIMLLLILCFAIVSISQTGAVEESTVYGQIWIGGTETDKIQRNGNVYTLTDDINVNLASSYRAVGFLIVTYPNIVIDGAGHTIQGNGKGYGVMIRQNNVTIKNLNIKNFLVGITFFGIDHPNDLMPYNQKILNNNITTVYTDDAAQRDYTGFGIYAEYANNTIFSGNTITTLNPEKGGIYLGRGCYNNTLVNNKLIGCGLDIYRPGVNTLLNNTIDGKPIVQFNSVSNQVIDDAEQVLLFNCTNMTIKNIHPSANYRYAIHLDQTRNSKVTDCKGRIFLADSDNNIIHNNHPKTIELTGSNYNQIFENTITDTGVCITLKGACNYNDIYGNILSNSSTGIQFAYPGTCQYNNIYLNTIVNTNVGIESSYSAKNSIYDNNIADCNVGISLSGSNQNRIFQNNIIRCGYAVNIRGSDNVVYHNNFLENKHQVSIRYTFLFTSDIIMAYSTNNTFDFGYPSGGNYWSDYNGTDSDGDGIGDTPYIIDENNQDNYPLVNVIPEFPSWIIIPLFLTITLVSIILRKSMTRKT